MRFRIRMQAIGQRQAGIVFLAIQCASVKIMDIAVLAGAGLHDGLQAPG